jgi:hypothetical protein
MTCGQTFQIQYSISDIIIYRAEHFKDVAMLESELAGIGITTLLPLSTLNHY